MKEFPEIHKGQFVLMVAEQSTGHILDTDFNLVVGNSQMPYLIFGNLDKTISFAQNKILEMKSIEYVVYDHNEKVIAFMDVDNLTGLK